MVRFGYFGQKDARLPKGSCWSFPIKNPGTGFWYFAKLIGKTLLCWVKGIPPNNPALTFGHERRLAGTRTEKSYAQMENPFLIPWRIKHENICNLVASFSFLP